MHDHFDDALLMGAEYALYRHGQDVQTDELAAAFAAGQANAAGAATPPPPAPQQPLDIRVRLDDEDDPRYARDITPIDLSSIDIPASWDDYIGQGPLKRQMQVAVNSALARGTALPHMLFASGRPGVGKTTIARMIAAQMGVSMVELVPPFDNVYTFVRAAEQLLDHDILFIDEIHLMTLKRRGDEFLLKILEEKTAYLPDGEVVPLNDITVIGATTEKDALKRPVVDRFKLKPFFQPYTWPELTKITIRFAKVHDALPLIDNELAVDIAAACRDTPRFAEEFILAARDLYYTLLRPPTGAELLSYLEVEPDGLTRVHIDYLTTLRTYFGRATKDDEVEYIAGEATMASILHETRAGIGELERFLIERGLVNRTARGRKLTDRGVARANAFIAAGKAPSHVA